MLKKINLIISIGFVLILILSNIAMFTTIKPVEAQLPLPPGVPRGDVLINDFEGGTLAEPDNFNVHVPGRPISYGWHQVCNQNLWYTNTTNFELISWIAAGPPEYTPDFKKVKIYLRKGVTWSDGKPFTADDVVYAFDLLMSDKRFGPYPTLIAWVSKAYKEDDYTVVVELTKPNPRFHYYFTAIIWGPAVYITSIAKHVWEKVSDPIAFKNYPPLCLGPYVLKDYDKGGNWWLWERNENWWGTKLYGIKPAPKYYLVIHYGTEEKKALAMVRHELDSKKTFTVEQIEIVLKNNPYVIGWRRTAPFAWLFDPCNKGFTFNLFRYPYNISEVRWALRYAVDPVAVWNALSGPDGSKPIPMPLHLIRSPLVDKYVYSALKDKLVQIGLIAPPDKVPSEVREHLKLLGFDSDVAFWEYSPQKAEELLKKVGFYRGSDGKWYLPTGEKWVIRFLVTGPFHWETQAMGFLIADYWKKLGIEVEIETPEQAIWATRTTYGDFDIATTWPFCSMLFPDVAPHVWGFHSRYCVPERIGGSGGFSCFGTGIEKTQVDKLTGQWTGKYILAIQSKQWYEWRAKLDKIIEEMEATPPWETQKLINLAQQYSLLWAEINPGVPFFAHLFYTPQDTYCWDGWPTYPDNYYMDPVNWWNQMLFIILRVYPTGRCPTKEATMPGAPPKLPIEIPTKTPTPTPTPTFAPTTVTTTLVVTQSVEKTVVTTVVVPTTVLSTILTTVSTTVRETDWTITTILAIILLIVGFVIGWFIKRK